MRSNSAVERDTRYLIHQQTNLEDYARNGGVLMARGDGVYVIDDQGNRYLEAMAAMWCASLGFSEKRLAEAAYKQMLELPYYHTFNRGHMPSIDLAEKLVEIAPKVGDAKPLSRVLLQCSGSEANDTAIKLIWYYFNAIGRPQKKKIIGRQRGYHGNTIATTSLSGQPHMHRDFDLPLGDRFLHAANPHYYRYAKPGESEEAFAERLAQELEALILAEGSDTIAAFFAEPVQGGGGAITPPATYFDRLQAILKKYEILFLVDEVICGFGRTGNMWGAETYGIKPDLLTCAKALSASYQPISALLLNEAIYEAMLSQSRKLGTFGHGFTYPRSAARPSIGRRRARRRPDVRCRAGGGQADPGAVRSEAQGRPAGVGGMPEGRTDRARDRGQDRLYAAADHHRGPDRRDVRPVPAGPGCRLEGTAAIVNACGVAARPAPAAPLRGSTHGRRRPPAARRDGHRPASGSPRRAPVRSGRAAPTGRTCSPAPRRSRPHISRSRPCC